MVFKPKELIDGRFAVVFPIKKGATAETYRVKDTDGTRYFLKLIDPMQLDDCAVEADGTPREIVLLRGIDNPGVPRFVTDGKVTVSGHEYRYFVTQFLSSETLADRLSRSQTLSVYDARCAVTALLKVLDYLQDRKSVV